MTSERVALGAMNEGISLVGDMIVDVVEGILGTVTSLASAEYLRICEVAL